MVMPLKNESTMPENTGEQGTYNPNESSRVKPKFGINLKKEESVIHLPKMEFSISNIDLMALCEIVINGNDYTEFSIGENLSIKFDYQTVTFICEQKSYEMSIFLLQKYMRTILSKLKEMENKEAMENRKKVYD